MAVYTIHEPPLRGAEPMSDPERFAFVRDGFSIWAFLFSSLWMLWHRLWVVLLIYIAIAGGLETALHYTGASDTVLGVVAVLTSLLVGVEASTLRRFTLSRRGWKNVGIISASNLDEAERRFFDAWVREAPLRRFQPSGPPPPPSIPHIPQSPDVVGLFPEPGATR